MSFYKEVPGRKTTLESTLKFDTTPRAGSTNPVTSEGVKDAIDGAVGDAAEALQEQIDDISERAGSGYIPKGEASVATLNGLSGQENGWLYTLTDAGTLTDGTLAVVAGDTVAWDDANSVWYKAMNYAPAQYGTNEVHNLPTSITAFRTGDYIAVDGTSGTAKMAKDDLLQVTAQNALKKGVAPAFDSTIDYKQGEIVSNDGKTYVFDFDHSAGTFSSLDCTELCAEDIADRIKTFIPNFGVRPFLKRGWYWKAEEKRIVKANAADVPKYCIVCFYNVSAGEKVYVPNLGLTLTILLQKADKTSESISFSWDGSHFVGTSTGKGNIFAQYTSMGGIFTDLSMFTDTSVKRGGACIDASAVEGVVNSATADIKSTLGAISQKAIDNPVQFCKAGYWYNEVTKKLTYQNSFSYCTEVFENVVQGETIYVGNWGGTVTAYHLAKDGTTQTAMSLPTFKDGYWPFVMPADGTFYFRRYSSDTSKFADLSIYPITDYRDGVFASLLDLKGLSSSTGKIVWVGTSIPAGARYPEDVASTLGYEVYNRAIGSSPLVGNNNKLALALSFAEKQALGICDASDTDAENASYENRLIPYIDGTTQKADAIVIDHGYNDTYQIYTWFKDKCIEKGLITQESDFDNGDGTYKDYLVDEIDGTWFDWQVGKTTWTAAEKNGDFISSFNFLVYTLRNTNPYLKFIVSSHLENKSCVLSQNTSWNGMCGKLVCKVQQILADHYGFYFMDVCNKTGWAKNIAMPNSSTFLSTYNATYSTNYFSYWNDANSNISVFQYFCPDGVHPQSDKSGKTRKYLSQIFIKSIDRFV